jgi:two-component system, NtrC family, sensor histidine kinase KinB
MKSVFLRIFWIIVAGLARITPAWASDENSVDIPPWTVYVGAIVVGAIVALVINRLARSSAKVELSITQGLKPDFHLERDIEGRLGAVLGTKEERSQVAHSIASVVRDRVVRQVEEVTTRMRDQYESALSQKDKEQEVVQVKYKNLVKEKNQTEAIVQSLAEGLVVVNAKGEVVMMNPAAEKLLGVDKKHKVGRPLTENLKDEELVSLVRDAQGQGEKVVELSAMQQETKKVIRSSSALIENENGQTVGMVSVLTDVTKQRELDRLKTQFVSTVTHELRTPLVATQKALDVVILGTAGPLNTDQSRFLEIAHRNLDRLFRLINDILDFSKLEAGRMKMEFAGASIEALAAEVIQGLESWAQSKQVMLARQIEPGLPQVSMDPMRIGQVLTNLIGNALKFTPPGGRVTVEAKRAGEDKVEVGVQDTGIGIAPEDLSKLFQRFVQVGERRQTDVSGTGLGLSIAKEIVELHGGRIWAESEKGQGTRFVFTLPLQKIS